MHGLNCLVEHAMKAILLSAYNVCMRNLSLTLARVRDDREC